MKRASDIILALMLGLLFAPIMALTWILVFAFLGRPTLYRQVRAGVSGQTFTLLKWRSMSNATNEQGEPLPDEQRITPFGRIIRRVRIDELPSIINILRGDLSFVGPRPLPASNSINQERNGARLALRPGLTGLAQVCGNTLLSSHEKLAIDLHYIRTRTLFGDCVIVWRTVLTVLHGEKRDEATIRRAMDMMEKTA